MRARGKRRDTANFDPERSTDPDFVNRRSKCCGCHPEAHDPSVGCLMCDCMEGIREERWIYEDEFSALVRGSRLELFHGAMRALGIEWDHDVWNGHRAIPSGDFLRLARMVRRYVEMKRFDPLQTTRPACAGGEP